MYYELTIEATRTETDIWLVDENGHHVQNGTGTLNSSVLGGRYFVVFGLDSDRCCPIDLDGCFEFSQVELEGLGMCSKPTIRFPGDIGYVEYDTP